MGIEPLFLFKMKAIPWNYNFDESGTECNKFSSLSFLANIKLKTTPRARGRFHKIHWLCILNEIQNSEPICMFWVIGLAFARLSKCPKGTCLSPRKRGEKFKKCKMHGLAPNSGLVPPDRDLLGVLQAICTRANNGNGSG